MPGGPGCALLTPKTCVCLRARAGPGNRGPLGGGVSCRYRTAAGAQPLGCRIVREDLQGAETRWHPSQIPQFCSLKAALLCGRTSVLHGGAGARRPRARGIWWLHNKNPFSPAGGEKGNPASLQSGVFGRRKGISRLCSRPRRRSGCRRGSRCAGGSLCPSCSRSGARLRRRS